MRSMTVVAFSIEPARKKIQAKQTTLNVMSQRSGASALVSRLEVRGLRPVDGALGDERGAVDAAPGEELRAGAVPEAAEQHRRHEVARRLQLRAARAAERDEQVVAQPAGERHVPATPEVLQAERAVRLVEVLREAEAEQQRAADCDVGVAAEVHEDLDGVGVRRNEQLDRAMRFGIGVHGIDDRAGEIAGDHDLLEQPEDDQRRRFAEWDRARTSGGRRAAARTRRRA